MKIYAKEYANLLVDIVEDFLDEKGIEIPNDEHEGEDGEAIIYGSDYDYLMDNFINTIKQLCEELHIEVDTENWEH